MVLIMVLSFFIALSGIVVDESWSVHQTEKIVNEIYLKEQAYYRAKSVLNSLIFFLKKDNPDYDSFSEIWAKPIEIPTPEGMIKISILDEERFLNINKISSPLYTPIFLRLFKELKISSITVDEIKTWITGRGIWMKDFPPKKGPILSFDELKFLGISSKDFYGKVIDMNYYPGLSQVVTIFSTGKVNINTAPIEVIMALSDKIDKTLAENIVIYRSKNPFKKIENLLMVDGMTFEILNDLRKVCTVKSNTFRVKIEVEVGGVSGEVVAILRRRGKGFKIIWWRFS